MRRTFEIENPKTGEVREIYCRREDVDLQMPKGFELKLIPSTMQVGFGRDDRDKATLRAFQQIENQIGASEIMRRGGFKGLGIKSASHLRQVWES